MNTRRPSHQVLRTAFHDTTSPLYRRLEGVVYLLIALSVGIFGVQVWAGRESALAVGLEPVDEALTLLFLVEYLVRVTTYRPPALDFYQPSVANLLRTRVLARVRFGLAPMQLVDLLTILAWAPQLRGLRAVRLLRLLRANRVFRYSNPFGSLTRAMAENRLLFGFGLSLLGLATAVGGLSFYSFEVAPTNPTVETVGDALWWALVTLTTVGYGDIIPATGAGRIIGGLLMVVGMFSLALFAGLVGHTLLHAVLGVREEQFRMTRYVNHIVVCGYEPGTRLLLDAVMAEFEGPDEAAIVLFAPGERPTDVPPEFMWISGDPTKESELAKVRMPWARAAVLVGSRSMLPQHADAQTILTGFTIRRYLRSAPVPRQAPLYLVAEILDAENVEHAKSAGVDEVIETTRLGFNLLAHALREPGTGAIMSAVASAGAHSVFVGRLPEGVEGDFGAVARGVKASTGALVIGLRVGEDDRINPPEQTAVPPNARVIYLAETPVLEPA